MSRQIRRLDTLLALVALVLTAAVVVGFQRGLANVWTGVAFLGAVGAAAACVTRAAVGLSEPWRPRVPQVTLAIATTTVMIVALELGLRWIGARATYGEQNGSAVYRSVYAYGGPSWYHTFGRNRTIASEKPEFRYSRVTNSLGLPEHEITVEKPDGEFRVLALGDSYTEGVGAAYDESWVKVFERQLSPLPDGRQVRTINAGVSASDPVLEFVLLRDRLARYRPDVVIVAMNNSDVADLMTRGGMDRFQADGSMRGTRAPAWDWLYGISYITRHVVHDVLGLSWLLMTADRQAEAEATAREHLQGAIADIAALSATLGARFVLVVSPHEYEVTAGEYEPGFKPLVDAIATSRNVEMIDLLAYYERTRVLTAANSREYYWALDYHHNARGYALMGQGIADEFRSRGLLPEP